MGSNTIKNEFESVYTNEPFTSNSPIVFSRLTKCSNQTDCGPAGKNSTKIIKKREIQYRYEDSLDFIRASLNRNPGQKVNSGLYVDQVLHKVTIDVNELGTEAAAATGISLTRDGNKKNVVVDVPFFFFIRHEQTKLVLFWGSVDTPVPVF